MRSVGLIFLVYLLAVLLSATSPIGAGHGVHEGQLLDPLVPHVHFVNGQRVVPGAPPPPTYSISKDGPAVGAEAGGISSSAGLGLTPPCPDKPFAFSPMLDAWRFGPGDETLPRGRTVAPPDPPPTSRS
jgi:hypothetical protein